MKCYVTLSALKKISVPLYIKQIVRTGEQLHFPGLHLSVMSNSIHFNLTVTAGTQININTSLMYFLDASIEKAMNMLLLCHQNKVMSN